MLTLCTVLTVIFLRPRFVILEEAEFKKDIEGKFGLLYEASDELLLGVLMCLSLYCILIEESIDDQGKNRLVQGFYAFADEKVED